MRLGPIALRRSRLLMLALGLCGLGDLQAQATPAIANNRVAGVNVIVARTQDDTLEIMGTIAAGDAWSPANNPGLGSLVARMLPRGTGRRDAAALTAALAAAGAQLGFDLNGSSSLGGRGRTERGVVEIRGRAPASALSQLLAVLSEQLRDPAFAATELEALKQEVSSPRSAIFATAENQAARTWSRAVYPEGHPNRWPTLDAFYDGIARTTVAELKAFHAAHYGAARLTLIVVGNIDPLAVYNSVETSFQGWKGAKASATIIGSATRTRGAVSDTVLVPGAADEDGRPKVVVYLGQATRLGYTDPDALALRLGTAIFRERLSARVMDTTRQIIAVSRVSENTARDMGWSVLGIFPPAQLDPSLAAIRREIDRLWREGVTAEELKHGKARLAQSYSSFFTPGAMLLYTTQQGYPPSWPAQGYPQALAALTVARVNAAIRKHLNPAGMSLVVAGAVGDARVKAHTLAGALRRVIDAAGVEAAVADYEKFKAEGFPNHYVGESPLNDLGYHYLEAGNLPAAIAVFRITVEQFPQSSNAHDSLGEAYLKHGERAPARQHYQRALEIDPKNESSAKALESL